MHDWQHQFIPKTEGIRTKRYKYFILPESKDNFEALFDLNNDPDELLNLSNNPEYADVMLEMKKLLVKEKNASLFESTADKG
jgi:arylsulfatase A-like enzyme